MDLGMWRSTFKRNANGFPDGDTWKLEFDSMIEPKHPQPGWKEYITRTSARFRCSKCGRPWPSNIVMVFFHMHLEDSTGTVKVKRSGQSCQECNDGRMQDPMVDLEHITILMKNLVTKMRIKCYNEDLDDCEHDQKKLDVNSSHDPDNCEACRKGFCRN
ncbi:receptor-transporting protein 3-like [Limanda limanda]|uniref:receptor-transporting protein 3-like n=1 Tax=Limanda limanda TaxID=27771 RepID=UPI0029C8FDF5|nr:receptor-transporting protein 3-like [Limanda limanda]